LLSAGGEAGLLIPQHGGSHSRAKDSGSFVYVVAPLIASTSPSAQKSYYGNDASMMHNLTILRGQLAWHFGVRCPVKNVPDMRQWFAWKRLLSRYEPR
jgi:hypothetical protein